MPESSKDSEDLQRQADLHVHHTKPPEVPPRSAKKMTECSDLDLELLGESLEGELDADLSGATLDDDVSFISCAPEPSSMGLCTLFEVNSSKDHF